MSNNVDIGPKKTMFILVVVIGCFSVLWPKVFYPMLVGSASQQMKPSPIDKTAGCCDVISETDVNTIEIMTKLCSSIVHRTATALNQTSMVGKDLWAACRAQILGTCGIDMSAFLQEQVRLGHSTKRILDEIRSLNGSLCLKHHFGVAPWLLGVPHRIPAHVATGPSVRQERPAHLRPEMLHPALRERGRAIPAAGSPLPTRVVDGRPGPVPGMRPPMGGPGHVVAAPQKGTSTMGVVMPIYTVGIVIFFTYTLMKLVFKKPAEAPAAGLYPSVQPDPAFRKHVFEAEPAVSVPRAPAREDATKLGRKERDTRDLELDQLRRRLRETELAMERIVAQMGSVPLRSERAQVAEEPRPAEPAEPALANGSAPHAHDQDAEQEEQELKQERAAADDDDDATKVKVLGMETTASCEGGRKWSRPATPVAAPPAPLDAQPPQAIYLEGSLPAQSRLLVSESATEMENGDSQDSAVVLSGKMTLSVISLDALGARTGPATDDDDEELPDLEDLADLADLGDESKYTTASNATHAENDVSEDGRDTDPEDTEDMDRD